MASRDQLVNALRKADAAGDVEAAKAIARRIKSMEQPQADVQPQVGGKTTPTSTPTEQPMSEAERMNAVFRGNQFPVVNDVRDLLSGADDLVRGGADKVSRMALKGLTGLPLLGGEVAGGTIKQLIGPENYPTEIDPNAGLPKQVLQAFANPAQSFEKGISALGFEAPQSTGGRLAEDVGSGIFGALTGVGLGQQLASASSPRLAGIGRVLAASPKSQVIAGATGGGAAGSTRELGGSPTSQLIAGLLGGIVAPMVAPKSLGGAAIPIIDKQASTVKKAVDLGYTLPPSQMNPTIKNRILEGIAGKLTTAQGASLKNQPITNDKVRSVFGISKDVDLTPDLFRSIRQSAGQMYDKIGSIGKIIPDKSYFDELANITKQNRALEKDFPQLASKQIDEVVQSIATPEFDARSAVEAVKRLRDQADINYGMADNATKAAAKAAKAGANALEDLIGRVLENSGNKQLLSDFQNARKTIAMAHSAEKALNPATGNIIASKLAKQLEKGKPLSGGLKDIAETSMAFPSATKEVTTSMPGVSPLDFFTAGGLSAMTQNPAMMATALIRPITRAGILSKPFQSMAAKPRTEIDLIKALQSSAYPALLSGNTAQNR